MELVIILKEILRERGLNVKKMARDLKEKGIRENTLYDIANNKISEIPMKYIKEICEYLDLNPGDWIKRQ